MNKDDLLSLPFIHKSINSCIDDNLEMLCLKLNRIYQLSFFNSWEFYFDETQKEISDKIYFKDELNEQDLKKYCGIQLENLEVDNFKETLQIVNEELIEGNPIMIHFYRKLFPWDMYYQKENVPNFFTHKAMAIDIDMDKILFTDGFCNKFNEYLSMEICRISANNKLTKIHIKELDRVDIKEFFNEFKQNQINKKEIFNNLEKFSNLLFEIKEIRELKNYNSDTYRYSRMCNSINKLIRSRKKVKELFMVLGEKLENETLKEISHNFEKNLLEWDYVNLLFTRYTMNFEVKYLRRAARCVEKIKKIEIDLYNQLEGAEL